MITPPRVLVSHPTGNTFVRALLNKLESHGQLERFFTTIGVGKGANPLVQILAKRRYYPIPDSQISRQWFPETWRLLSSGHHSQEERRKLNDQSYQSLDHRMVSELHRFPHSALHAYEDGAASSFKHAKNHGIRCSYELPIAHWETVRHLLGEEAERLPEWEPTLESTREPEQKLIRKEEELALADCITCPSTFVLNSIPREIRERVPCQVAQFGSPKNYENKNGSLNPRTNRKLKLLFVGSMSQRKGLADLLVAMNLIKSSQVSLTLLGQPSMPLSFYRSHYRDFEYLPPRSNENVRKAMAEHDVLVLPSIVEGRALVQQEALSCGLPLLVTPNAGGDDLIEDGQTGFLSPIRAPNALAEKIEWFCDHRDDLPEMSRLCKEIARRYSWDEYANRVIDFCLQKESDEE